MPTWWLWKAAAGGGSRKGLCWLKRLTCGSMRPPFKGRTGEMAEWSKAHPC